MLPANGTDLVRSGTTPLLTNVFALPVALVVMLLLWPNAQGGVSGWQVISFRQTLLPSLPLSILKK